MSEWRDCDYCGEAYDPRDAGNRGAHVCKVADLRAAIDGMKERHAEEKAETVRGVLRWLRDEDGADSPAMWDEDRIEHLASEFEEQA